MLATTPSQNLDPPSSAEPLSSLLGRSSVRDPSLLGTPSWEWAGSDYIFKIKFPSLTEVKFPRTGERDSSMIYVHTRELLRRNERPRTDCLVLIRGIQHLTECAMNSFAAPGLTCGLCFSSSLVSDCLTAPSTACSLFCRLLSLIHTARVSPPKSHSALLSVSFPQHLQISRALLLLCFAHNLCPKAFRNRLRLLSCLFGSSFFQPILFCNRRGCWDPNRSQCNGQEKTPLRLQG